MKTFSVFFLIASVIVTAIVALNYFNSDLNENLELVKSGKISLYCQIGKDYKLIDKDKIISYSEVEGKLYWFFTNGEACNCYLEYK